MIIQAGGHHVATLAESFGAMRKLALERKRSGKNTRREKRVNKPETKNEKLLHDVEKICEVFNLLIKNWQLQRENDRLKSLLKPNA